MFSKIRIPLDGREEAAIALAPASTIAEATGASMLLLTVVDGAEDARVAADLARQAADLTARGVPTEARVRAGVPAPESVAAAVDVGADLIAMVTHGRSGRARAVLGSVAERVVAASPVPFCCSGPAVRR
jgi:nucleotide-binding universal stress UspA family protein